MNDLTHLESGDFAYRGELNTTLEPYHAQDPDPGNMTYGDDYEYDIEESINTFFWDELLPTLCVYTLTFILGLVGNILIIFTTFSYRKMKSTTNVFLASLASADLLLIVFCIPVKDSLFVGRGAWNVSLDLDLGIFANTDLAATAATNLSHVISGDVKRLETFRQRRSARYALEWLDRIKPDSRDLKLDSSDREKVFGDHFAKRKPFEQTLPKAYAGMQKCSVKSFAKYNENLRESRKMRSRINESFLKCWHPVRQEMDLTRVPEESRDLVPSKNGKIFRYKEEHIELLSVDVSDKPHSGSEHKRSNIELCHPFLQPFLSEKRNLRNGQNSIRVDEMSREAVVIYRRNGHKRIDDWKNYQIEQFAFGKANFGLMLDTETKRSSSETREKSSSRQARVTRRRRSKFRYEPVKIGRSVSIEFKKFDEIREMFDTDKSSPIFRCSRNDNAYFWKSNEFRLRSSAEKKLNLFKEMKKNEKYRRKKFQETIARSLNYRCAIAESFSSHTPASEDVVGERVEGVENPRALTPDEAKDGEYKSGEVLFQDNSPHLPDCPSTPGDIPVQFASNNVQDILDELVESKEMDDSVTDDMKEGEDSEVGPIDSAVVIEMLKKDDVDKTELEELILKLQTALRDCHKVLAPCNPEAEKDGRTVLEEEFPNETVPCSCKPIIAYPVSTAKSGQSGRASSRREEGFGRMKKLKNYDFDDGKDMFMKNRQSSLKPKDQAYLREFIGGATETLSNRSDLVTSLSESSIALTVPESRSAKSGKSVKTEKSAISEKSWKTEKSPVSKISTISRRSSVKLPRRSFIDSFGENKDSSNWESTKVVEKRILKLECRLKELLRRIGVYPTKEQDAIKRCLERLKETSEAVLKRLRVNCLDGCKCAPGCQGDRAGDIIHRGYQSEPESTIKMNKDQKSIILKTSGSEIQLNVGMEITMENFDPVTGEKLRPEENRDFEQQGNIQCKLVKPGEKPVTFINTDFLYNPKTGMLFKGNEKSGEKSKNQELPLKPTKTYLLSRTTEPPFPQSAEPDIWTKKNHRSGELSKREDSFEGLKLPSESRYRSRGTSPGTSKSAHSDAFRLAVEREEMRNVRYLEEVKKYPFGNLSRTPGKRDNQKRVSLAPTERLSPKSGQSCDQENVKRVDKRSPEQTFHLKEIPPVRTSQKPGFTPPCSYETASFSPEQDKMQERGSQRKADTAAVLSDKHTQTSPNGKKRNQAEVIRKKSTGVQAEVKTRGKVFVNRAAETTSLIPGPSEPHKRVNACVQTLSSEQLSRKRRGSDAASQTNFIIEETKKYLKDLETQKRVNLAIAELCYHLSNGTEIPGKLAKLFSFTWTFGYFVCKMVYYMQSVSSICSVLTLTAMSVERYYAIVHPMRAQYICTISQARKIITFTWISSIFLAIPVLFAQIHMPVGIRVKGFWCVRDYDNPTIWRAHETYMLLLILVIPTSVMGVAYVTICLEIWQVMQRRQDLTSATILHNRYNKASMNSENFCMYGKEKSTHRKAAGEQAGDEAHVKQVIKMLVAVVVIYVVCWSPLLIDNVLQAYGLVPYQKFGRLKYMSTAFHLMAYFNSCINPIIYGFMSKNFRESFRKALCCHWRRGRASVRYPSMSNDRSTSIRYAESRPSICRSNSHDMRRNTFEYCSVINFGRTVSVTLPD